MMDTCWFCWKRFFWGINRMMNTSWFCWKRFFWGHKENDEYVMVLREFGWWAERESDGVEE